MKILVTYNLFREGFSELEEKYDVTFPEGHNFSRQEILERISEYDALCSMFDFRVDKELIDKGKNLKIISNYAVGYNNIDVSYALSKGITVANTPDSTTGPTANIALGLILDTARKITYCDRKLRQEGDKMKIGVLENLGAPIIGKTLGIIGFGRIGQALAKRAIACGMNIIYYKRNPLSPKEEELLNVTYKSKEELLQQADFISLNAPLNQNTKHLISTPEFELMKPTAILINTARGPMVDEKALIEAIKNGKIKGAGLDVFEFKDRPLPELLELEQVVLTPHIGTQTYESRLQMANEVSNNVIGFFEKDRKISIVTQP